MLLSVSLFLRLLIRVLDDMFVPLLEVNLGLKFKNPQHQS